MRRSWLVVSLLFLVSGALGLVYETLWMRRLAALLGGTAPAAAATLSGFFLGLGAGSLLFGDRVRRASRPLAFFGLLEMGVGLGALAVGPLLDLYRPAYAVVYGALSGHPAAFVALKFLLAAIALAVPAACMGGSLPALAAAVEGGSHHALARLYRVNVLGAALGALAVPFVLLPRLGVSGAEAAAVSGSFGVGGAALLLARRMPPTLSEVEASGGMAGRGPLLLGAASGAATLGLQALWMRMFALVHESSVYSFTVVVVVFLLGLAGGAGLAGLLSPGAGAERRAMGWSWSVAGILTVVSPWLFHRLTDGLEYVPAGDWSGGLWRLLGLSALILLPPTVALGVAVPLLLETSRRAAGGNAGRAVGRLLAANTAGAIAGPVAVTFLIAPGLGLWWSLAVLGTAVALVGAFVSPGRGARVVAVAGTALGLLVVAAASWPPVRLAPGERLISVREGALGTTAVLADARGRWISVNNTYVLGGTAGLVEERWQAHLPLLLHPAPRRVAFVGLGTAITAGGALLHPVEEIVALEIVPEVVEAARQDFAETNGGVLDDPRTQVVVDDGRNYLAVPRRPFDVVVGDLLVPWRPGEAALYTREHFGAVREALAPEGIFCQWLPLYQLSPQQAAMLIRTFVGVFPQATLWRGGFLADEPTLALVGRKSDRPLDAAVIDARVHAAAGAAAPHDPFLAHPAGLWMFLIGAVSPSAPWLDGVPANTDAHPWVELASARHRRGPRDDWGFLDRLGREAIAGDGTMASLDQAHREWRGTGARLWETAHDRSADAPERLLALLRTLPVELRTALQVDAP